MKRARSSRTAGPLVVWRFRDGKRGHDNQSAGLIEALSETATVRVEPIDIPSHAQGLRDFLIGGRARRVAGPDPQLLVGAGHATHAPMLCARRARGGRIVCLMRPTFPRSWFDLCVVPRHDGARTGDHVFVTDGPINRIRPGDRRNAATGLILVGGPSRYFRWDEAGLMQQIETISRPESARSWTVATSRRTPAAFAERLHALGLANVNVVDARDTRADWLPRVLSESEVIWVTPDSASMMFEAVSSGAAVGLLELRARGRANKLARAADDLIEQGRVTAYARWRTGAPLAAPAAELHEAHRCARWILRRWFHAG